MDSAKYIGLDVHKESISIAVLNAAGVPRAPSLSPDPRPSRTTRKSNRLQVSDRTMVGTPTYILLL